MKKYLYLFLAIHPFSLAADDFIRWNPHTKNENLQAQQLISTYKDWTIASIKEYDLKKKHIKPLKIVTEYREATNETSVSVDCGVICELKDLGITVKAHVHYFFEGKNIPDTLSDNFTITFNVDMTDEDYYLPLSSLTPRLLTKKESYFVPIDDGMGLYDDDIFHCTKLAKLSENDCRRLLKEQLSRVFLGPILIHRGDQIENGLRLLIKDVEARK